MCVGVFVCVSIFVSPVCLLDYKFSVFDIFKMSVNFSKVTDNPLAGKESTCNVGDLGSIPGFEDPLEKGMATHSSILA